MRLYIDTDSNRLITEPKFKSFVNTLEFKRGDSSELQLVFVTGNTSLSATNNKEIIFSVKENGKYDGTAVVYTDTYSISGGEYILKPSFNTVTLNALLSSGDGNPNNDIAVANLMGEITWSSDSGSTWKSTNTFNVIVNNDVIKGIEGTPLENPNPEDWFNEQLSTKVALSGNAVIRANENRFNLGFGTTNIQPANNTFFVGKDAGVAASNADNSNFIGACAGLQASNADNSNFIGMCAGACATGASKSNFIGLQAGSHAQTARYSNFIGYSAGRDAYNAYNSNFIGRQAGFGASQAFESVFIGTCAGLGVYNYTYYRQESLATNSVMIGNQAGAGASNASQSVFIGSGAGYNSLDGSTSIIIGANSQSGYTNTIVLGVGAVATEPGQLVLGSYTSQLNIIGGEPLYNSTAGLKVNINGGIFVIPLLAYNPPP
jgi:hypothetical protein